MAKVIMTIAPENDMCFEDIMSFKTTNYTGLYATNEDTFILLENSSMYFEPYILKCCDNLKELDDIVFAECGEHIVEVFDNSNYTIELDYN